MAGVKDLKKRAAVRKMLKLKRWQRESCSAVAREAGVCKNLVNEIRRQMIASGQCPPLATRHHHPNWEGLKPGRAARGGYVYSFDGTVVRETVWLKQVAARKKLEKASAGG